MYLDYQNATNKIVKDEILRKLRTFRYAMIFGGGESGDWVRNFIENEGVLPRCIIDNYVYKQGTEKNGLKILSFEDAVKSYGKESCICIGSLWADEILEQIANYDPRLLNRTIDFRGAMVWEIKEKTFISTERMYISKETDKYNKLFERLADDESRYVLESLLNYRITRDRTYLQKIVSDKMEYVDETIVSPRLFEQENCEMIDGGAFDGDSVEAILNRYDLSMVTVHCYEPLHANAERITSKMNRLPLGRIVIHESALYKTEGRTGFKGDGLGGTIQNVESRLEEIPLECIDDVDWKNLRFIKLDIEGAERDALYGGRKSIEKHRPVLAICAYHKQDDLLALSDYMFSLRDYRLYLRHYMNSTSETIMYGIPYELDR